MNTVEIQSSTSFLPLIEFKNVSVTYRAGSKPVKALENISWRVYPNEHWAICGHNGAGKSTLLRLLRGDQWPDGQCGLSWRIGDVVETSPLAVKPHVGLVSPELQAEYIKQGWHLTGEELLLTGFSKTNLLYGRPDEKEREEMRGLVASLSSSLDIDTFLTMPVAAMSQGQLRRLLLARSLLGRPKFLILDEFSDGIDAASSRHLHQILEKAATHASLFIAAHQIHDLPACITHGLVLAQGNIIAAGPIARVRKEVASIVGPEEAKQKIFLVSSPVSEGQEEKKAEPFEEEGAPVLELAHIDLFLDGLLVLKDINWTIREGENWLLIGENGAGKTSLLRMLWGEEHYAWGGEMRWFGKEGPFFMPDIRRQIGLVSDRLQALYHPDQRGIDIVLSGFFGSIGMYETPTDEMNEKAWKWMEQFGIAPYADQLAKHMSYGRLRRFLLCRAMVHEPRLLFLDEPCSGLDKNTRISFLKILEKIAKEGTQLVCITHRLEERLDCLTHVLTLHQGQVQHCGPIRWAPEVTSAG